MYLPIALSLTLLAVSCAAAGIWLSGLRVLAHKIVPLSGVLLAAVALFGVLPETAEIFGWAAGLGWMTGGFALLWSIDRYVYPVCPSCSHTHDHGACGVELHGFALPLILAAGVHSFLDGWGIAASGEQGSAGLGFAVLLGIGVHKVPEGLALGVILRASMPSRVGALGACALAEGMTVAGAAFSPHFGMQWASSLLALVGGTFLYLGYHAVHGEYRRLRG